MPAQPITDQLLADERSTAAPAAVSGALVRPVLEQLGVA